MILTTPFHPRTEAANRTGLWSHWQGYLAAERYQTSEKAEYWVIRNSAGLFDTSPLYKYRIRGVDAERFLAGVLTRDIRRCPPGRAQYTVWCDGDGHVIEDGVVLRLGPDEFLLTAARPNLAYFSDLAFGHEAEIVDESVALAGLAIQGPRSGRILSALAPEVRALPYFGVGKAQIAGVPVVVSRTGFTGDLGYELWVGADDAVRLWDAVVEAAEGHGVVPVGQQAILMARIEAGLILIDVDYTSARFAWTDTDRVTPIELGLGWMLGDLGDDRPFIGRDALRRHRDGKTARWVVTGLVIDWRDWEARHDAAGLIPPKDHRPDHSEHMVYDSDETKVGWVSSMMYSPLLQRHIALARVRPDLAEPGTRLQVEVTVDHDYTMVGAEVTKLPFYDPPHKTSEVTE